MPKSRIDDTFIKDFFQIGDAEEDKKEIEEIKSKMQRLQFENGKDICVIDGEPDCMFFLESGTAIVLSREGEQINIMHEGQYFGEYGVLSKQKRLSTVRSLGRTIVYRLDADDMMNILAKHPEVYGELMKRVYGQVSGKHSQILALSGMRKGILQHPKNETPLSKRRMVIQYGILALIYVLCWILIPKNANAPVFLAPLALMLVYVLITKRTVESLIVSSMLAALLVFRNGISASFSDAMIETMMCFDNAWTVFVMALMGSVVQLIEASGAVTAFKKMADSKVKSQRGMMLAAYGIMAATCIDDGLNMACAANSTNGVAKEQALPREKTSLLFSLLPTVLSSFIPISLWGIFVIGTLTASIKEDTLVIFCKSIPFNFFSILVVIAMLFYCFGKLPMTERLKNAEKRVKDGGTLWPDGSEKYLSLNEPEMWGKIMNIMLPIAVLAASSIVIRSIIAKNFMVDSAVGLVTTLVFMFLLYCWQGLMTPEQFVEHLVVGIANSTLPILLYLLTMCFSTLLSALQLTEYFSDTVEALGRFGPIFPMVMFVAAMFLTVALGSSWSMYAIVFPIAIQFAPLLGVNMALCIGAIAGAGIAGEKNCMFTADSMNVGTAIGCSPRIVRKVRMKYSFTLTVVTAALYLLAGFIFRA
ncbi:MAG: cyclic nucleotide-binding domain-containing protein [Acetatifactor sp.]|jgi:Na+/H+ antiporter NhaC|nr:cyclic nucleotide-binding domain-containing protein [Acetatifactor sp.]